MSGDFVVTQVPEPESSHFRAALAVIQAQEEIIKKYAQHSSSCNSIAQWGKLTSVGQPCSCGLAKAKRAVKKLYD